MEHYILIGKQTGIRNFMDRLDILSTYLPLFQPLKGEVMKELTDIQKSTIMSDSLPNYCIKKIKEANNGPIEISLEALFQFSLNIEGTAVNYVKDSEGNARSSKYMNTETTNPRKQGVKKARIIRRREQVSPLF
jgi:hypothetical protein